MSLYPLPPLILFEDYQGIWENYKLELYKVFLDSIVNKLIFLNLPIRCRYFQPIDNMYRCFWHLISEGALDENDRFPDMRRCERLGWIAHIINNHADLDVACWENKRGQNSNTVLWLPSENYMIVLSRRKDYYLLVTAYPHSERKIKTNERERKIYMDPR